MKVITVRNEKRQNKYLTLSILNRYNLKGKAFSQVIFSTPLEKRASGGFPFTFNKVRDVQDIIAQIIQSLRNPVQKQPKNLIPENEINDPVDDTNKFLLILSAIFAGIISDGSFKRTDQKSIAYSRSESQDILPAEGFIRTDRNRLW